MHHITNLQRPNNLIFRNASIAIILCIVLSSQSLVAASNKPMPQQIVFSDIDGTLVHYPKNLQQSDDAKDDLNLIFLPPSKTGSRGVLSKRTLELCHKLRHGESTSCDSTINNPLSKQRTPLILVSGMRTTTLFQRLPYLPRADAYVSESGGRIFYPSSDTDGKADGAVENLVIRPIDVSQQLDKTPFRLVEDLTWRKLISDNNAAGLDGYGNVPLEQRKGKLWEYSRHLVQQGYVLDTAGYSTAFRINRKQQSVVLSDNFDEFIATCAQDLPKELGCSTNLGCVDIYPLMSGKKKCCEYLVQRFLGVENDDSETLLKTRAFCMCDDDNDIEMAAACKAAFLPSITSESIRKMVAAQKESHATQQLHARLIVTEDVDGGIVETSATERALELILKELRDANTE